MNDDPELNLGPAAGMVERIELHAEVRRLNAKLLQFVNLALDQGDEIDRLKAENARLTELVKLHMAADLARADLDED